MDTQNKKSKSGVWKPIALIVAVGAIIILSQIFGLGERIAQLRGWISGMGAWGAVVYIFIYAAATVAALPGSALTVVAGALFGSLVGVIVVSIASTLGAALSFLVSRYFARDAVARWLEKKETFARLDRMTETHGAVIVALTRLVPIFPFNLLNFGFGLTRVRFGTYVFWSWLCMLPGTVLYVVGADALIMAIAEGKVPWGLVGVLAATAVFITVIVRIARKHLSEKERSCMPEGDTEFKYAMPTLSPKDEHNITLTRNVHPADWHNPMPEGRYNLVVIGAGTAGLVTAAGAAGLGAKVALVERHLMGGDCLNVGCVPSKAIIRSSRAAAQAQDTLRFGAGCVQEIAVDFPAVMERMRRIRAGISDHDSARRFSEELGVDLFLGHGRFSGPDTVCVGDRELKFKKAVIATGARPGVPPIPGLAEAGFLTNETIFNLTERPGHIVFIGGGPIGCELAQAMRRLGSDITIIEMAPQFLIREDPDASGILARAFQREGIQILLDASCSRVEARGKKKALFVMHQGVEKLIEADEIMVGAGRIPNIDGLGLEAAGVETSRFGVVVTDQLRTTNRRIYAAGDVAMAYKFTHMADFAARIVIQNALFGGKKKLSSLIVPWTTYTDPEIAHVGMYENEARDRGLDVDTYIKEFSDLDRAILDGEDEGFVKIHTKKGTDTILGATIVARHAGDMISEITLAMAAKIGLGSIASVIHPYPTRAEAIRQIGDMYNRTKLTPFVKGLFEKWLTFSR